jgi:hypothetical protein
MARSTRAESLALTICAMWTCPKCQEPIEDQFDSCWRCAAEFEPVTLDQAEAEAHYERDLDLTVEGVRNIRKRRSIVLALFLFSGPLLFVIFRLFGENVGMYTALLHGAVYLIAGQWEHAARCPRCGERFYSGMSPWLALRGRCWSCRLALNDYLP